MKFQESTTTLISVLSRAGSGNALRVNSLPEGWLATPSVGEQGRQQRGKKMANTTAWRIVTSGVVLGVLTTSSRAETITLPTFDVVATTPLGGGDIDVSKSPFAVWQTNSQDIQTFNDTTLPDTLARQAPGVTVGNVSGNDFQPDLSYRGFDATAVTGTPIGLAVYQNGVRINEAFGDTVNWELIPENAIDRTAIIAANPIFGLNALGGAVTMKYEERLHLAGVRSRYSRRLIRACPRGTSVRQADRQLLGLCGGHADQ